MKILSFLFVALSLSFAPSSHIGLSKYSNYAQQQTTHNEVFEALKSIAPQMELSWEVKGADLMKSQVKYNQGLTHEQVKALFQFDKKGEETLIWNDANDYGAYGQYSVFEGHTNFLIYSEYMNEESPEMESRLLWLCSMDEAGKLVDYTMVASYSNLSEGMEVGKTILTRNFSHNGEHGFSHYQDTEHCPNPTDCKSFSHEERQLDYFEDGTFSSAQ